MSQNSIESLQARFPRYTIRSLPASGCKCNDGVRIKKDGSEIPCICVCMSAPGEGEKEYRTDLCKAVGAAARKILNEINNQ